MSLSAHVPSSQTVNTVQRVASRCALRGATTPLTLCLVVRPRSAQAGLLCSLFPKSPVADADLARTRPDATFHGGRAWRGLSAFRPAAGEGAQTRQASKVRLPRVVGSPAPLFEGKEAERIDGALERIVKGLPGARRRLARVMRRVKPVGTDSALEAEIARVPAANSHFYLPRDSSVRLARRRR